MRTRAKRDTTEAAIVQALEAIGVQVLRISSPGCPDLLLWREDTGYRLVDAKTGKKPLTPRQEKLRARMPFDVVRSVDEALRLYGVNGNSPDRSIR